MADSQDRPQRGHSNYPYPSSFRRRSLPRRNTDIRPNEPTTKYGSSNPNPNRLQRRFTSGSKVPDSSYSPSGPAIDLAGGIHIARQGIGSVAEDSTHLDAASENESLTRVLSPSVASTCQATAAPSSHGSNSSAEGGSTATERPFLNGDNVERPSTKRKKVPGRPPNALNFLDSDSPMVTPETIRRSVEEASHRSPTSIQAESPSTRSASSTSSGFRDDNSDKNGDRENDRSTSPERIVDNGVGGGPPPNVGPRIAAPQPRKRSFAFPDTPRGSSQHLPFSPIDHTQRAPSQGQPPPPPHPRAERVPITGYELLSSRLSASAFNRAGPRLRPIYRRFETLNHRMLLHLQDEICELEEQLHQLDAADTQARRLPNCIFPASRRAEYMAGGELYWRKTDTLGKIGFKLDQYNRILSSFRDTVGLPTPSLEDIHEYRSFLTTHAPLSEAETHFLDASDDLVCLSDDEQEEVIDEPIPTPMPRPDFSVVPPLSHQASPMKTRPVSPISPYRQEEITIAETVDGVYDETQIIPLSIAITIAVIIPILTFLIIPGYLGRLTVVLLVGLGILGALIQGGIVSVRTWELLICVGLYGAVMAMIAGIVS